MFMKSIYDSDFAYFIGYFLADGSFYKDSSSFRFELVDGSPYTSELDYSIKQLNRIKLILEKFLDKKLPDLRRKGNMFILSFRNILLSGLFLNDLGLNSGKKAHIVDIPNQYKNSEFERDFWIGYLDGDGSIARDSKRIALESMSKSIIISFSKYLDKLGIYYSFYESRRGEVSSYVLLIRSISFGKFVDELGFRHPAKVYILSKKIVKPSFYRVNEINFDLLNKKVDYFSIFDKTAYLVNAKFLLEKYGYSKYHRNNFSLKEVFDFLSDRGLSKTEIINEVSKYRFKKSKGSTNSVKLPINFSEDIFRIAKFIRLRSSGIIFSKKYIKSYNEDYDVILSLTEKIFDIKPVYTSKNEPLFCSGILKDFFNYTLKNSIKKEKIINI